MNGNSHLREKAVRLRQLHHGERVLLLPNVWDVISARVVEQAGYPAIATSSAGVAAVLGYPDGQRVPRDEMLAMVAPIARAVTVPVTADLEAGYGRTPEAVAEMARLALEAGAVGFNLEDLSGDPDAVLEEIPAQVERIRAARAAGDAAGVPLVINARTDVFLAQVGDPATRLERALERGQAYLGAGADCIFYPGVSERETIARLVRETPGPINILAGPASPPVGELEALGVARVSLGSSIHRATLALLQRIAVELRDAGTYASITQGAYTHADVNRLLAREG